MIDFFQVKWPMIFTILQFNISFWKKSMVFNLKKYEPPNPSFVPSLLRIGPVVLEMIFKNCQRLFTILQLSPLGKGFGT